jgi:hypothetical protein
MMSRYVDRILYSNGIDNAKLITTTQVSFNGGPLRSEMVIDKFPIMSINIDNIKRVVDKFDIPLIVKIPTLGVAYVLTPQFSQSLSLIADSSKFPFDDYYINLTLKTPFSNNATIYYSTSIR